MIVTGIRVSSVANDLGGRVWNPAIRWTVKHAVFVELESGDGLCGLGECWCFDAAPDPLIAFLRTEVAPAVIGRDSEEIRDTLAALTRRATLTARHGILASALSGIDIALWDLEAQALGRPLWQALNPDGTGVARLYASGGLYGQGKDADALAGELAGYADRGFFAVKMKIGGLSFAEDVARVEAARRRLGPDVGLIIDGVYSYSADEAAAMFERVAPLGILAFQSPVRASDIAGMRRLAGKGIPVMAVEAEYRDEVFAELIEERAVAILQVSPIACGGVSRVAALAGRAERVGIALSMETSSTAVATLAAAHLAAAFPVISHVEFHMIHQVFFDRLRLDGETFRNSNWRLPAAPGLGLTLDPVRVAAGFHLTSPSGQGRSNEACREKSGPQKARSLGAEPHVD